MKGPHRRRPTFHLASASAPRVGVLAIVVVTVLGGCRRKAAPPDLSKFLGTWSAVSGGLTITCSTKQVRTLPVTEPITFVRGTDSQLLDANPVCPVKYDVVDGVATALPGQTCSHPKVVTKLNLSVDTFTTGDGVTGTLDASGKQDGFIDIVMGWPVKCTFTETASYKRVKP